MKIILLVILSIVTLSSTLSSPYANDYPYQKYGFNREGAQSESEGSRFSKNKQHDQDNRLKSISDSASTYNLDSAQNHHNLQQAKKGGSHDNLTHIQGENFENDRSHKRKHVKSGFQNSYHKDENGSRTSFYEDSDDNGEKISYDKRHGTRGDQLDSQFTEGLKNGFHRDKHDDRRADYENRDHTDRSYQNLENQGKRHEFNDNRNFGAEDQFEIVRRPYSDSPRHNRIFDDFQRFAPQNSQNWV